VIVIGCGNAAGPGGAFVFERGANGLYSRLASLVSPSSQADTDLFGRSVCLSVSSLVIGAWKTDLPSVNASFGKGVAYVYPLSVVGNGLLSIPSPTTIAGDLTFTSGHVITFSPLSSITVTGTLTIQPGAAVLLLVNDSGTYQFVVASEIVGTFSSVLFSTTSLSCQNVAVSDVTYSSSTISAVVDINSCGKLSSGAVAGIIIGAVFGGIVIAGTIVLLTWWCLKRTDITENRRLQRAQLHELSEVERKL